MNAWFDKLYETFIASGGYKFLLEGLGNTIIITLGALAIGDVSFIFASFEMFSETGRYIRENSPYDMTFICTLSLGSHDYIPSDIGFELNCYEAYTAHFEQDTAKNIADQFISTLKDMKG